MRLNSFQRLLGFLALFGAVYGSISPANTECTTHAWVRAEDLTPSTIVRGSAKIKISAGCPPVESVLLGLRLKERSFMKALLSREERKRVLQSVHPTSLNFYNPSPWAFPLSRLNNHSDEAAFYGLLANKDAWIIREEERIVFETTQPIPIVEGASLDHDVVHHFSVLVPSTNFPPAQDYMNSGFIFGGRGDAEIVDVESMNEYFIRVSFVNGTTEDISAGFTGFQPLYDPTDSRRFPISENIALKQMQRFDHSPATNYTAQISAASDMIFTEGSENQFVTMVITRTGPARNFSAPLTVRGCIQSKLSSKWAAEYDMSVSEPWHAPGYVLRSTLEDVEEAKHNSRKPPYFISSPEQEVSVMMPNSTADEIQSHDIVTTTSTAFTIPVKMDRRYITNFDAYYQTITNSLMITLVTPRTQGGEVDPDDLSATQPNPHVPQDPVFEDDEEEWVPWMKRKMPQTPQYMVSHPYSGTVQVTVRPLGEVTPSPGCLHPSTDTMSQDILSDGPGGCERPLLTHYLDEGARGPIFVDRSTVREVLAEDPAERELRAPIIQPVVSSPPGGEELIYRYYRRLTSERPPIYVGETWARKVSEKGKTRSVVEVIVG